MVYQPGLILYFKTDPNYSVLDSRLRGNDNLLFLYRFAGVSE